VSEAGANFRRRRAYRRFAVRRSCALKTGRVDEKAAADFPAAASSPTSITR
jgi:hypothetical protein